MTVGDLRILLTSRATLLEPQLHTTATGLQVPDWSQEPTNLGEFRCAVQHRSGEVESLEGRRGGVSKFRVYFDVDTPARRGQRIKWGTKTLELVGIPRIVFDHLRGTAHHLEIEAELRHG